MRDFAALFDAPAASESALAITRAIGEQRWDDVTSAIDEALAGEAAAECIGAALDARSDAQVVRALVAALERRAAGPSSQFWYTQRVEREASLSALRRACARSESPALAAAWVGLAARALARVALAESDGADHVPAMVDVMIAHGAASETEARWYGVDALMLSENAEHLRHAERLARELLASDRERRPHAMLALGALAALRHDWPELLRAWSGLGPALAPRPGLGRFHLCGGVFGVVHSCLMNLELFPSSLSPLLARCCLEIAELRVGSGEVGIEARTLLEAGANGRLVAWLDSVSDASVVVDDLATLACADSPPRERDSILQLARRLDADAHARFEEKRAAILDELHARDAAM